MSKAKRKRCEGLISSLEYAAVKEPKRADKCLSLINWYREYGSFTGKQIAFAKILIANATRAVKVRKEVKQKAYYLYAMSDGVNIKLGFSCSLTQRLSTVQTHTPKELRIVWKLEVGSTREEAIDAEKKLHRFCRHYRRRGEWFGKDCMTLVETFTLGKARKLDPEELAEREILAAAQERI